MNKKFLSAILFGAMMTASTTVFVSCEDYGDDIAHLQEQIDQNATTAESELAAKVAALQAQLSTLEAAQKSMTEQLAAAKAEVATAAANAAAAAQTAQAAADKAQGGADEAKAAAAAAQAAADKANQTLSEAVARVAVLEAKATSLQASIDELSAASKEASAKLAEIQALVNTLNASTTKNAADIAKLGEQVSALNAELGKVSTGLSARIDAIDKELNTIKTTYATKSELDAKAEVLANMDAQLKLQIESNLNYIKEMQAAIASLGEKDKELAAAIEKNYADVLAEIEELATSQAETLAALEAAVKAGDAKLDEAIKAVQAVAEANAAAIKDIQAALATKADKTAVEALAKDLAQAIADIAEVTADLAAHKTEVAKELADINAKIADLDEVVQGLVSQALTNWNAIVANQEAIENLQIDVMDLISQLTKQVAGNWDAITKNQEAIFDINEDLTVLYDLVAQLTKQVTANWDQITKNMESIVNNTNDIADLDGIVSGLIKQVQGNWDAIVANQENIVDHEGRLNDIEEVMAWLIGQSQTNWNAIVANQEAIQNLEVLLAEYPALEKTVADLVSWTKAYDAKYDAFVKEQNAKIEAEIKKLTDKIKNIDVLNAAVVALQGQLAEITALLNGLHSVEFVPAYTNTDYDLSVYHINTWKRNSSNQLVNGDDVFPVSTAKFRIEPAGFAKKLAEAYAKDNTILKMESANKLVTTRSEAKNLLKIESVKADGDYLYVGVSKIGQTTDATHPSALVIANTDNTLSKTSDYFKVKFSTEQPNLVNNTLVQTGNGKGNAFKNYTETSCNALNVLSEAKVTLKHNVFDAYNIKSALTTNLKNANASIILPYDGVIESNLRIVSVNGQNLTNDTWKNTWFTVKSNGDVTVNSNNGIAIPSNVGKNIKVKVVDDTYQLYSNGNAYVEYDITFEIVENRYELTLPFTYAIQWPKTTADAQEITLKTIEADAAGLNEYKLKAADVFTSLCNAVGTSGVTYTHSSGNYGITMKYVPAVSGGKEAHITVTPFTSLAMNYNADVTWNSAAQFVDANLYTAIKIKVNYDLSVPGVTDFFNKIKMYWTGDNDNTLEVNYTLAEAEGTSEYTYTVDMKTVYLFNDWTPATVDYEWTVDKASNVTSITGIEFTSADVLNITGPVTVYYNNSTSKVVDPAELTFTAKASNGGTTLATTPGQKFNVTYPIDVDNIAKPDNVTFKYSDLKAGKSFDATSDVSLTDIDGYTWIHNGAILAADLGNLKSVATAWKIQNLKYEVVNVTSAGQDLTSENLITIAPAGGDLIINKPANITKLATVTIQLSFDYKYQKGLSTTYKVFVDPTL